MDADIGGNGDVPLLGLRQHLQGAGTGEAAKMDASPSLLRQGQIPCQGHCLRRRRDARQAQPGADLPLVGAAIVAQERVLGAQEDRQPEGGGVLHGPPQHQGIEDRAIGLAHDGTAGLAQGHHLADLLAIQALGQGPGGHHPGPAHPLGGLTDELGHRRGVDHRPGVRRAAEGSDPRRRRRRRLAGDGALVLLARLAEAGAEIDQAGTDDLIVGIQNPIRRETRRGIAHRQHPPLGDMQVQEAVDAVGGVDEPAVTNTDPGVFNHGVSPVHACSGCPCTGT